ncbi:nitrogen fixation protein NifH, partial [Candidatus Bathyarchaeota archaeon]|nr:nitrogen fixation protein NifH [Candidatus Bathyarchaeota archaeon]
MNNWKSMLKADPTNWLLEEDNPSVRYFTLTDLLKHSENTSEVAKSKQQIMKTGIIPQILSKQKSGGYWGSPSDFYVRSKYKGTVWTLILLAELGADGKDERVRKACEFILRNSQHRESGAFSYFGTDEIGGRRDAVIPCLTGNMVYSLLRFGLLEDEQIQHAIEWIAKYQRFDDGLAERVKGWPYDRYVSCWGKHSCHMGVIKALKALAEIPVEKRSSDLKNVIDRGVEYVLAHHIYKRSHDLSKVSKPSWMRFGFPKMWQTDVLEILQILTKLGIKDERMQEAIDLVVSKQNDE